MSAEDETYDIDLYGDEPEADDTQLYDAHPCSDNSNRQAASGIQQADTTTSTTPRQGVTEKAPKDDNVHDQSAYRDERPLDQGAQVALKLTDLQWWTTEEDLRCFCAQSQTEAELVEVAFGEHKINGKSKGEAYLEFQTPQAAGMVKREIEKANAELEAGGKISIAGAKSKISVWYTAPGNPYRVREGQGKKETADRGKYGQQGAYNNYNNNSNSNSNSRGGFVSGRGGRGGYNPRGGAQWPQNVSTNNHNINNSSNSFGNNMMGGYGNMSFGGFPGMGMNQNAMMNSMMAGGGFNMMTMSGMMGGRGGGNMMNRGGWSGAMQQGNHQRGGYNTGWDSNKRQRQE